MSKIFHIGEENKSSPLRRVLNIFRAAFIEYSEASNSNYAVNI